MLLMLAALGLWCVTQSYAVLLIPSLLLFFIGFNFLEAALPARISQCAPPENKGAAMGIYSSLQFFGMFCGGVMGGTLYGSFGLSGLFMGCSIVALCWCVIFFYLTYTSSKHVGQN
jgi:predicted MFS family arabinose efflux permease